MIKPYTEDMVKESLEVSREGERILLKTSQETVRLSRRNLRIGLLAAALLFFGLAFASALFLIAAATAIACLLVVPWVIKTAVLIEIDAKSRDVILRQSALGAGLIIPRARIKSIEGIYETQGWDPRNAIYAALVTGKTVLVMALSGTDELLAEDSCRVLGELISCPATYTGAYNPTKVCFDPRPHS